MEPVRHFAVIPAAGRSRRMGCHKLMLPWHGVRVIDSVLQAWTSSRTFGTIVVVRREDRLLQDVCRSWPVTVLPLDVDTPDMKSSIQQGLAYIQSNWNPPTDDRCLFAPADLPGLTTQLIDRIIAASVGSRQIVAPLFGDRRGHPVSFPWEATSLIFDLNCNQGLSELIERCEVKYVPLDAETRIRDIDTPHEYQDALRAGRVD